MLSNMILKFSSQHGSSCGEGLKARRKTSSSETTGIERGDPCSVINGEGFTMLKTYYKIVKNTVYNVKKVILYLKIYNVFYQSTPSTSNS